MQLTRDAIQRIVNGSGGGAAGAGGSSEVSMSMLAGYATEQWVNENFVSIEFFNRLFTVHGEVTETDPESGEDVTTEVTVLPNDLDTLITNIEARFTLWTQQAISAMGLNDSGGGGGGGASTLADLLDVNISNPSNGQVLYYNATQQRWVNGYDVTAWLTSSDLTNYALQSWVQNNFVQQSWVTSNYYIQGGTIHMGNQSITPLTSFTETDPTVPAWAKAANKPSYSFSELTNHPTTLSGYGITDAKIQNGTITLGTNNITPLTAITSSMVTTALGYTPVSNAVTWWGQPISNGAVSGNITGAGNIQPSSDGAKTLGDVSHKWASSYIQELHLGTSRYWYFGNWNKNQSDECLFLRPEVAGKFFYMVTKDGYAQFKFNGDTGHVSLGANIDPDTGANLYVQDMLRIGNVMLKVDSSDNLYIQKANGGAANFYATGGVSALGFSGGSGGPSIEAATIGTLTSDQINIKSTYGNWLVLAGYPGHPQLNFSYGGGGSGDPTVSFGSYGLSAGHITAANLSLSSGGKFYLRGSTVYLYWDNTNKALMIHYADGTEATIIQHA